MLHCTTFSSAIKAFHVTTNGRKVKAGNRGAFHYAKPTAQRTPGIVELNRWNSIELNRWIEFHWIRQSNKINLTPKKIWQSNSIERPISWTLEFCKTGVENQQQGFGGSSYFSITCVFRNRTISGEMASDLLWVVSFKYVVKGYQECRIDVKKGEEFKV